MFACVASFPIAYNLSKKETYDKVLADIKNGTAGNIQQDLYEAYSSNLRKAVSGVFPSGDNADRFSANVNRFAAYKSYQATQKLIQQFADNPESFDKIGKAILNTYNRYQAAEYNTAIARCRTAKQWDSFMQDDNKFLFPNMRWLKSTSAEPREAHRIFWDKVWAKTDPFWNDNQPGNLWNCKCDWEETADPVTDNASVYQYMKKHGTPVQKGLNGNPAKTGELFTDECAYIKSVSADNKAIIEDFIGKIMSVPSLGKTPATPASTPIPKKQTKEEKMMAEMPDNLTDDEKKAIAKNNIELEKTLGKKGEPMTVDKADKQNANPNLGKEKGYNINCQTCAPAYMLRLRGFDITAKPKTTGSKSEYLSKGSNIWEGWKNYDGAPAKQTSIVDWMAGKKYKTMTPKRYKAFFEETCKDEGVYELVIFWKSGGGHATILQRFKDGELRYIEPQHDNSKGSGREFKNLDYLSISGKTKNIPLSSGIIRIDNKVFNNDYSEIFSK